jgi:hypothetical protein
VKVIISIIAPTIVLVVIFGILACLIAAGPSTV